MRLRRPTPSSTRRDALSRQTDSASPSVVRRATGLRGVGFRVQGLGCGFRVQV